MIGSEPFLGAEALAAGTLNRHQLRTHFRAVLPGVYLARNAEETLLVRTVSAWLWSRRRAVIGGQAAAAMLGAKWVDRTTAIDLFWTNSRPPPGVRTHQDLLADDEIQQSRGLPVTTAARTGFDLARRGPLRQAVARVDALLHATSITPADIALLTKRHPGVRGLRMSEDVLSMCDPGAESPRETWLRLLLRRNGLPVPQTQIEVYDDRLFVARLDMGWPEIMVAVEYDGDQHRTDRRQYVRDMRRLEMLEGLGWIVVRVVAEDTEAHIVRRVRAARDLQTSRLKPRL